MSRRALVTGANGFLGRHVVSELGKHGWTVTSLRFRFDGEGSAPRLLHAGRTYDSPALDHVIRAAAPDLVLHLAGSSRPVLMTEVNAGLAFRLIGALRRVAPRARLVLIGSAAEYGAVPDEALPVREDYPCRPLTPYGVSKYAQTLAGLAAAADGLDVLIARCFNLVGPGMPPQSPLMEIAAQLSAPGFAGEIRVGKLDLERDLVDVAEAARSIVALAGEPAAAGQVVNVCSGKGRLLRDFVDQIIASVSPRPVLQVDDVLSARPAVPRMIGHPGRLREFGLSLPPADPVAVARSIAAEGRP